MKMYKVKVEENCIGCGACTLVASDIFEMKDGKAITKVPETDDEDVVDASESCPVNAITISEE